MFFVYAHLKNGNIFYIGKGSTVRAKNTSKRTNLWKQFYNEPGDFHIRIMKSFESESDALRYEALMISQYSPYANQKMAYSYSPQCIGDEPLQAMSFCMPDYLYDKCAEKAKEQGRSLSNYIRLILAKHA